MHLRRNLFQEVFMPNRKRGTSNAVRPEPWELEYVHREFPTHSEKELEPAIESCKKQLPDPKDRKRIAECVSKKIR